MSLQGQNAYLNWTMHNNQQATGAENFPKLLGATFCPQFHELFKYLMYSAMN